MKKLLVCAFALIMVSIFISTIGWAQEETIAKSSLYAISSIRGTILDPNNKDGVWQEVSPTEVRLKPNTNLTKDDLRKIVPTGDVKKVWAILQQSQEGKTGNLRAIEILPGYGLAKLRYHEGDYRIVPFFLDFDSDLKPLIEKKGINYPGLLQFVIEPFASYISRPRNNAEIGNNFGVKIGLVPDNWKIQPYFKVGVGAMYLTQHFKEQATQFNFDEFAGLGLNYFFTKNVALTFEYRYRHISNACIKEPNDGIGTNIWLCGVSYFF
jgi:hypothetical protein